MADESKLKAQAREIELLPCPFCGNAPTRRNGLQFTADVPKDFAYCETETCPIKRVSIYLDEWNAREQVKAETADLRDRLEIAEDQFRQLYLVGESNRAIIAAHETVIEMRDKAHAALTKLQEVK